MTVDIHKLIDLGGREWIKNGFHRVYFSKDILIGIINFEVSFYKSGNISSASLRGRIISIEDAELLHRDLGGQFYFNVATGAWNWKDMSDRTAHMLRDAILAKLGLSHPDSHVNQEQESAPQVSRPESATPGKVPMRIRYRKHIEAICRNNDITIETSPGSRGRAWAKSRVIKIPEIKTGITYALALHEIGHILGVRSGKRLEKEVQAWEWAMKNAIEWTQPMNQAMERRLGSYLIWCQRRKGVWVPPADHPAWKMANLQPKSLKTS
jgi:hypothetical protein